MANIVGEFEQAVEASGRLAIPMGLRSGVNPEADGGSYVVSLGSDWHLWIFPENCFKSYLREFDRSLRPERRDRAMRMLLAHSRQVNPDGQGRVIVPERLLELVKLKTGPVMLVGSRDHIEVWPREEWQQYSAEYLEAEYPQDVRGLSRAYEEETPGSDATK